MICVLHCLSLLAPNLITFVQVPQPLRQQASSDLQVPSRQHSLNQQSLNQQHPQRQSSGALPPHGLNRAPSRRLSQNISQNMSPQNLSPQHGVPQVRSAGQSGTATPGTLYRQGSNPRHSWVGGVSPAMQSAQRHALENLQQRKSSGALSPSATPRSASGDKSRQPVYSTPVKSQSRSSQGKYFHPNSCNFSPSELYRALRANFLEASFSYTCMSCLEGLTKLKFQVFGQHSRWHLQSTTKKISVAVRSLHTCDSQKPVHKKLTALIWYHV